MPLSYRFNAEEMAYVIDNSDATTVVVDAEQAPLVASVRDQLPKVRAVDRVRRRRARRAALRWDDVLRRTSPTPSPTIDRDERGGRGDDLHVGHHGKPKGALRTRTDRQLVFALLGELNLLHENSVHLTTGPLYHSGPLAFASLAHTLGAPIVVLRKFDAARWIDLVKRAPRHEHVLRADPAEAHRVAARRRAREGRHVVDGHA